MSQDLTAPFGPPSSEGLSWNEIWWTALTDPSPTTYEAFANDPRATSRSAYKWIVSSAVVAGLVLGFEQTRAGSNFGAICLGPIFAALFSLFAFAISIGITQSIAKALGGQGTYAKLAYATAAYNAPLVLITAVLSLIPFVGFVTSLLGWLYGIALSVIAVKGVNQFGWARAIVPVAVIFAAGLALVALWVIAATVLQLQA